MRVVNFDAIVRAPRWGSPLVLAAALLAGHDARAQGAPPPPAVVPPPVVAPPSAPVPGRLPAATPGGLPLGQPGAGAPPAPPAQLTTGMEPPPSPTVSDPLLEPVPPAARMVSGWQEALALVRARSTDLRLALGDLERAQAATRIALAAALPTLSAQAQAQQALVRTASNVLNGEAKVLTFPAYSSSYGGSVQLTVPIFNLAAWHNIKSSELGERATELALAEEKRVLAAAVADALVSVITAERVADLNRSGLRASLERLSLTKRRADLGAANALDVLRVEQDAAQSRATIVSGDESLRQARESLGLALGFPVAYGVPRDLNLDAFAAESSRACPRAGTVEDRTDVASNRARMEAAKSDLKDIELSFAPTVNLVSNAGLTHATSIFLAPTPGGDAVVTPGATVSQYSWTLAGVLSWNIFDGGVRYGQMRDMRAQIDQATARTEAARRVALLQVQQTTRSVGVAEEARKVAESSRALAKEAERLTRVSFNLGRSTSLELVDSGRSLRDAEITLALREFDTIQAKIRALLALSICDY